MRPEEFKAWAMNKMKKALQLSMTAVAGEALEYVKNRFVTQTDPEGQRWAPRKKETKKTSGRALLVQTGRLSRNNRYENIRPTGFDLTNRTPYAAVHNYGGTITRHARTERFTRNRFTRGSKKGRFKKGTTAGRGFTFSGGSFRMTKRTFIGNSPALRSILSRKAKLEMIKRMKQ